VPDAAALASRLRARIAADGPLRFDAWVESCLYDVDAGFYARGPRLGPGGAFTTAPTLHPAFAAAVVAEAAAAGAERVLEAGPGDGALAEALVEAGLEVVLLERAEGMRRLQRERLGDRARWIADPSEMAPFHGLVVANELLDAIPFRLFADDAEVFVGLDAAGRFIAVPAPRARAVRTIQRPQLDPVLRGLADVLQRGRLLLVDYAAAPGDPRDPVRTYIGGRHGGDPLQAPGTQDITADVDFAEVRAIVHAAGLTVVADEPQAAWLRRHGAAPPPLEGRTDDGWRMARLFDETLPFHVVVAERA
jgi:SAM-dependent MidA family methyltransferase